MARPKKNVISLTDNEVNYLKSIMKKKATNQTLYTRCHILLNLDEAHLPAMTYDECINVCHVSRATIAKLVQLFASGGTENVLKVNRKINSDHANRKVDGRTEARRIEIACGPVPEGHSRWTIRLLEECMKVELEGPVSQEAIRRSLKKTGLDLTAVTTGAFQV